MYVDTKEMMSLTKFYEGYSRFNDELNRYETWDESVDRVMDMHKDYYSEKMSPELEEYIEDATLAYKNKNVLGAQRALQFGGDQLLKHQMKMYNCFAEETEFVTSSGMKSFKDFNDGDIVVVKTHTGAWKKAIVRSYGKQKLNKIAVAKDSLETSKRIFYATANHRWILEDGTFTDEIKVGDNLYSFVDDVLFDWNSANDLEKLYWCYGMIYGDGTVNGEYSMIRLCGNDVQYLNRFEYFGWKHSKNGSLEGDVIVFTGKYKKTLPDLDRDDVNLIKAFVNGYLTADGTKGSDYYDESCDLYRSHFSNIYAKKKESSDFIRRAFPIAGYHISSEHCTMNETNYGIHDGQSFSFVTNKSSKYSKKLKVLDIQETDRYENVWCLEVEDDHSFILKYGIATGNCTSSYADRAEFFGEIFYILLCGAGAGFSVQKQHVKKLPKIQARTKQPKMHVIEDSIEGWATSLDVLLSSYFVGGGKYPEYAGRRVYFDLSQIRPKGAMISGGFKAPGPEPLRQALDRIEYLLQGLTLNAKTPVPLTPIAVYDIVMHSADAVLAGGVRRSATICLFSSDDTDMASAKTGNWFVKNAQRARSNNSAVINRSKITYEEFDALMQSIKEYGEPGFFFVDDEDITTNPCVEIGMYPQFKGKSGWQGCNLTEINGGKCTTEQIFYDSCYAASILGTLQAGYTNFNFLDEVSKKIFEREALLGVSITGWMNNPKILFDEKILEKGAKIVLETNAKVAKLIGINSCARGTCAKPSGNASVLLQTASGIHGEHSPMYIRNIQLNKDTEIAELLRKTNPYMVEESVWSASNSDYVVSFPVIAKKGSLYKEDLHGVKHLELVKKAQKHWVEAGTNIDLCVNKAVRHNISNTIIVDDWEEVSKYVFENREFFAGISFLSPSGDRDYEQAPNTTIRTPSMILQSYKTGALFASGLVVDALKAFNNSLWMACMTAQGIGEDLNHDSEDSIYLLKKDWVRRYTNYSENYFDGDMKKAEYCLKDVYLLHKWEKIQQHYVSIDWENELHDKKYIDIDTTGASACYAGACEI